MKDWDHKKKGCRDCRKDNCDRSCSKKCDKKYCFGDWGQPRDPKCPYPCKFEECNFSDIPTGSLYFAEHWDLYGAIRSGAAKQKYSLMGIIFQLSDKRSRDCKKKPYVLTVMYDRTVKLYELCDLVREPLIVSQAVRPKLRACNKCVDKDQENYLFNIACEFLGKPFEEDSAQVARSIFDIPASNPNTCSYTDTELVYRIIFKAALLGDCCPKNEAKSFCLQKCDKFDKIECSCTSDPCKCKSKKPCEKTCCGYSSSTTECEPCDKIDCYRASAVSICDFITGKNLDLRWFANLIPVYTACLDPCKRSEAVDRAFSQQMRKVTANIRSLVGCWLGGESFAYWKGNDCNPCDTRSSYCGQEVVKKVCEEPSSSSNKYNCNQKHDRPCDQRCDTVLCRNAEVIMTTLLLAVGQVINTENPGTLQNYRIIEGNLLVAYFQRVIDFMASICGVPCDKLSFRPESTSYVTYTVGNLLQVQQAPLYGFKVNCEEDVCEGARRAIETLKTVVEQLVMPLNPGTATSPRVIQGSLMVLYFQTVLDFLASLCNKRARQLRYDVSTQFVSYKVTPLMSPFDDSFPLGEGNKPPCGDSYNLFNKLVSQLDNNI